MPDEHSVEDARAAEKSGHMRYVLGISVAAVVIALAVILVNFT